jgi:hypothetical protein
MELAAEACCKIFTRLSTEDKEALTIRLVTIGALVSGEPVEYVARICAGAHMAADDLMECKRSVSAHIRVGS